MGGYGLNCPGNNAILKWRFVAICNIIDNHLTSLRRQTFNIRCALSFTTGTCKVYACARGDVVDDLHHRGAFTGARAPGLAGKDSYLSEIA